MVSIAEFTSLCLAYDEAIEQPHFEKNSFRIRKKIFATLDEPHQRACLKLPEIEQSVFCDYDRSAIYPVPNTWGKQGWTFVELNKVNADLLKDALTEAYCCVAPKKLALKYRIGL